MCMYTHFTGSGITSSSIPTSLTWIPTVDFDSTKGYPGEGPSSWCSDDSDGLEQMVEARVAAQEAAQRMEAAMDYFSCSASSSRCSSRSSSEHYSDCWDCEGVEEEPDGEDLPPHGDTVTGDTDMLDSDDPGEANRGAWRDMMKRRTLEEGSSSRKGSYARGGTEKRRSHAEYAYTHFSMVEQYSIGRPCTSSCPFGRNCGQNITPKTLMACHEYSYGTSTSREECTDSGNGYKYNCEFKSAQTHSRWRDLFAGFITRSAQDTTVLVERFMVDGIGPVCADYCGAAYGVTTGRASQWALDNLLAAARSGNLQHLQVMRTLNVPDADDEGHMSYSMDECIEWWSMWLELEDQMPNEPTIVHRVVVWGNVYKDEYLADCAVFGTSRPLSLSRWTTLRQEALRQLSIEYFGLDANDPEQKKPAAKLSLRVRASHSNFAPCPECEAAKALWADFRKDPNRL
jgi:hypothetical protein